jgi:hypothetical protein
MDSQLWKQILSMMPKEQPSKLPVTIGKIDDATVQIVDGDKVKRHYFMDFVEGGNSEVYHWMHPHHIWLDGHMDLHELPFILYHEVVERRLMKTEGMGYNKAHKIANRHEKEVRARVAMAGRKRRPLPKKRKKNA